MTSLLFILLFLAVGQAQVFRLPDSQACAQRRIHYSNFGKNYHFSWVAVGSNAKFNWVQARNYCRRFCMDAVSFDTRQEYQTLKEIIRSQKLPYIWTSGRKCNFNGCGRVDLQPALINGWFWANSGKRIPPKSSCDVCDWSNAGGLGQSQPDNREFRTTRNGEEEACIAVLNNFYNDDIRWHDVGCSHTKPVICQDEVALLNYARQNQRG